MVTLLTMFDFNAAFDAVDHQSVLLHLNHSYGIGGTVLSWLESFLTDCTKTVTFAGKQSMSTNIRYDVPQGSLLGLLLHNLCTADIIRIAASFGIHVYCYADDIQLSVSCLAKDTSAAVARLIAGLHCCQRFMDGLK